MNAKHLLYYDYVHEININHDSSVNAFVILFQIFRLFKLQSLKYKLSLYFC